MALGSDGGAAKRVFVARERELAALRGAWESARRGNGRVVAIEGEPGIGKSAPADIFSGELAEAGHRILRVQAIESGPPRRETATGCPPGTRPPAAPDRMAAAGRHP